MTKICTRVVKSNAHNTTTHVSSGALQRCFQSSMVILNGCNCPLLLYAQVCAVL
jgi:hypothetical protein